MCICMHVMIGYLRMCWTLHLRDLKWVLAAMLKWALKAIV